MFEQKHKTNTGNLSGKEINDAEKKWIKYVQTKHHLIEQGGQLNDQQCKSQLNPKIKEDVIITVHGKYSSAELPEETVSTTLNTTQRTSD